LLRLYEAGSSVALESRGVLVCWRLPFGEELVVQLREHPVGTPSESERG
jgi:hypothetical protein